MADAARLTLPALGVCYYPEHWPEERWPDDARRMREAGISVVRIAEFTWGRIEPEPGRLDFEWLDRAVATLGGAGLRIVLCTPTATPPKWLVDEMPDMLAIDAEGRPRGFGSRRHYCFSHQGYRAQALRIARALGERYGNDPHVVAWQIDNEYGCHDTTVSYSGAARAGFRDWLARRYQSAGALNRAWGAVFWSMEVGSIDAVELPNLTVTESNPSHRMDFLRYSSDQVVSFNRAIAALLRELSPGRDIVHNFMGKTLDFDHFAVCEDLDVATWDSYPTGFLERGDREDAWKRRYLRGGDPDYQAFHHDLYRACGAVRRGAPAAGGRWWVMEQQPGPVNWAPWNPDPLPGMVRLWTHEAFAHGAEVVSYFRWRQAPSAQEQMHSGLLRPDGVPDRGLDEVAVVAREIAGLPAQTLAPAEVALVFDYETMWAGAVQPHGADFDAFTLCLEFYSMLRRLGQGIDVVGPGFELSGYRLVVVPCVMMASRDFVDRLRESTGRVVVGPRSGSRTADFAIPDDLPPGDIRAVLPIRVVRAESLRPGVDVPVRAGGSFVRWFEHVEAGRGVEIAAACCDGRPALLEAGRFGYVAGWPDEALLRTLLHRAVEQAGLTVIEPPGDLRFRDRGRLRTIVNYGPVAHDAGNLIGEEDRLLTGGRTVDPGGVTIAELAAVASHAAPPGDPDRAVPDAGR